MSENFGGTVKSSAQRSLKVTFDEQMNSKATDSSAITSAGMDWCHGFSISSVNPRQALRSGAVKLSQTFNSVRTTFDTLSQKLRRSTRRRQPLSNVDSPQTPITPDTKSRHVLGRTPTKLYSPFGIETPQGKENFSKRCSIKRPSPLKGKCSLKRRFRTKKEIKSEVDIAQSSYSPHMKFGSDLEEAQYGIYEFQSTAHSIVRRSLRE